MLGLSYGEIFLILGATAAVIGPKDLPRIAKVAGRLAGRSIGYVQMARGQFDNVMQQSQAQQVHKELQETIAQLEAIRHEIRTISFVNPGPMTRRLVDNISQTTVANGDKDSGKIDKEDLSETTISENNSSTTLASSTVHRLAQPEDHTKTTSPLSNMHSQAATYERLAGLTASNSVTNSGDVMKELAHESGLFTVLPVSAESAGLVPNRKDGTKGSDIVLEAILEAEVARNAKEFFVQPQNQIKAE